MCVTDKIFDKICLKAIVFPICGLWSEEELETQFFVGGGDIQQKRKVQTFGLAPGSPSLSGTSWCPHKENPQEGTLL